MHDAVNDTGQDGAAALTFKELVEATGESDRTLRYYLQLGMLFGPTAAGPAARYSADNVRRVEYIRARQRDGLGLRDIQRELAQQTAATAAQLGHLAEAPRPPQRTAPAVAPAAIDTLAHLLGSTADASKGRGDGQRSAGGRVGLREQWERHGVDDGIEIWVRRPLDPHRQKLLTQLLAKADELFAASARTRL